MSNKLLITALAAMMTVVTAAQAPAETVKKKKIIKPAQSEESANKEAMDELMLGVAVGVLGGAMKKGKMPKGGKEILKHGLKAVKEQAKKDSGKKDSGKKKDPLKMLLGGGDEE